MKTKHLYLICCILFSVFLLSCSSINHTSNESNSSLATFYYKTFRMTSSKPLQNSDTTYFYVSYPEFSDAKINEYVQSHLVLDSGKVSVEEMGKEFITAYDQFYDEVEYKRPWYQEKRDSVNIQTVNYIGFSSNFESYTGGAHGLHYILYNNYDVKENKELSISDIIHQSNMEELIKAAEGIFRKQEGISETHSLLEDYFFEDGIFSLPNNFILQHEGILFLYNIYEIKPYVSGYTDLFIPYSTIKDMLTPEAKEIIAGLTKHTI